MWQVSVRPDLPILGGASGAPAVGMPSFWPFSSSLAAIAAAADDKPWQLYRADPQRGPNAPAIKVERFTWATLIDIRIKRIPGRPHTAEVIGADTAARQLLLELWEYLEAKKATDTADLFFGFQLSPAAGLAGGLASIVIDPDVTYLVRTNLSDGNPLGQSGEPTRPLAGRRRDAALRSLFRTDVERSRFPHIALGGKCRRRQRLLARHDRCRGQRLRRGALGHRRQCDDHRRRRARKPVKSQSGAQTLQLQYRRSRRRSDRHRLDGALRRRTGRPRSDAARDRRPGQCRLHLRHYQPAGCRQHSGADGAPALQPRGLSAAREQRIRREQ